MQLLQPEDSVAAGPGIDPDTQRAAVGMSLLVCLAAADVSVLAATLTSRPEGAPWLLQPLVRAPTLVAGDIVKSPAETIVLC